MRAFLQTQIEYIINILLAPIYFHLGHYSLTIEILSIGGEIVDTVGLFFLLFFFLISITFYRNAAFQIFVKSFFKNYIFSFNTLPLNVYFPFIFKSFLKFISFLLNKILFFFIKRK